MHWKSVTLNQMIALFTKTLSSRKGVETTMLRRAFLIYAAMILMFTGMICRVYMLSMGDRFTMAASSQSAWLLEVGNSRGMIYDRKMVSLVENKKDTVAAILPSPEAAAALSGVNRTDGQPAYDPQERKPYLATLPRDTEIYSKGVELFETTRRYLPEQIAPHIIGYLRPDGQSGAAGIELAFDELLKEHGGSIQVRYTMDALGMPMTTQAPSVTQDNYRDPGGVVLTLDAEIQRGTQRAMAGVEKGAAVVMDVQTGDIVASVSMPSYDPDNLGVSLKDSNSPFVNRAYSQFNVGSTFKILVAAAALEMGYGRFNPYYCGGHADVNGHLFYCHWRTGHGELDMKRAIEVSCNPYFINLGLVVGGKRIVSMAREVGFGRAAQFTDDLVTQSGTLPTLEELELDTAVANLSFGQGSLTATPIQIAQLYSTIANGGNAVTPRLVTGFTDDGKTIYEHTTVYAPVRVFSERTSEILREYLVSNVEKGSGKLARPLYGMAGGKTGSAQTGIYLTPGVEDSEVVHAWFAGFYPAQQPKYAIAVLVEGGGAGSDVAAPIFKKIADAIYLAEL